MSQPTETQAGAFFSILAGALILVLTAMALESTSATPRQHHAQMSAELAVDDVAPPDVASVQ